MHFEHHQKIINHCKVRYVDSLEKYVSFISIGVQKQLDSTTAAENGEKVKKEV